MKLGFYTYFEGGEAGLLYITGGRWSWALIQNWREVELGSHRIGGRWNWALTHNWREVELGSPTELEVDGTGLSYRIGGR